MRKLALSSLALGAAMVVGTAQAEPLTLSGDQMDQVTAAGYAFVDGNLNLHVNEDVKKKVDIWKTVFKWQDVEVRGYFAQADAGANCYGDGCQTLSYAITDTDASKYMSTSVASAESATSGFFKKYDGGRKYDGGMKY